MERMFFNCHNLKYLNIENFQTKQLQNVNDIFTGVIKFINIIYEKNSINDELQEKINNLKNTTK